MLESGPAANMTSLEGGIRRVNSPISRILDSRLATGRISSWIASSSTMDCFITPSGTWNKELLVAAFLPFEMKTILQTPIGGARLPIRGIGSGTSVASTLFNQGIRSF